MNIRALIVALVLLCGTWKVMGKQRPKIAFRFEGWKQGQILLQPMIAPGIGVELESGPNMVTDNEILMCDCEQVDTAIVIGGEPAHVSELKLKCGDRVFSVKGLKFEEAWQ